MYQKRQNTQTKTVHTQRQNTYTKRETNGQIILYEAQHRLHCLAVKTNVPTKTNTQIYTKQTNTPAHKDKCASQTEVVHQIAPGALYLTKTNWPVKTKTK